MRCVLHRPNNSKTTPGTPYLRQQSHWDNKGRHGCPIKFFDEDLKKLIKARFKENDHVVLVIDANEDVRSGAVKRIMDSVGMRDGILDLHRDLSPPETCNKNHSRVPIDAMCVSHGIQLSAGGYSGYGVVADSDHRCLWMDIPYTSILGFNPPKPPTSNMRRLKAKDPRCRDKYIKITKKKFAKAVNNTIQEMKIMEEMKTQECTKMDMALQHSKVLKGSMILRLEAARKARHLFNKSYEWSPQWKQLEAEVKLWRVARFRFKRRIKGKYLRRLMKRAGNEDCFQLSEEELHVRHKNAVEALNDFKPHAAAARKKHLQSLAKALAEKNNTTEESEFKKLTNQDAQRKLGAKLKRFSKKGKKGLARKAEHGPLDNPEVTEDKAGIEGLSATENETRFTNCLRASEFTTDPVLLEDVGYLCEGPAVSSILDGTYHVPDHLSHYTKIVFLEHLPMPEVIRNNPMGTPKIPVEDHTKGWKKARESTASEPTTLDFSHYISAAHSMMKLWRQWMPPCEKFPCNTD